MAEFVTGPRDRGRRRFLGQLGSLAALGFLPAVGTGCGVGRFGGGKRHVIFISLDTTRADLLAPWGNPWIRTPNLDALAAESIVLEDYMTAAPSTLASHVSLFTGKYPHFHGAVRNGYTINPRNRLLTNELRLAGWRTAGFLGSFALHSLTNFHLGFEHFDETFDLYAGQGERDQNQRRAGDVTDAALSYLSEVGDPERLFLFVHYFDPHMPYEPPPPFDGLYAGNEAADRWLADRHAAAPEFTRADCDKALAYAGEVSYLDAEVGRLLVALRDKGILDEALLVLTGDHGENFREHPEHWDHGFSLYQQTLRVPGLIRLPDARLGGLRVPDLVGSVDILPTVLQWLDLPAPPDLNGEALDLTGERVVVAPRRRFAQATRPVAVGAGQTWPNADKARCVRDGRWKFVQTPYLGTEELYDLKEDPRESRNLLTVSGSPAASERARQLRRTLESWAAAAAPLPSRFGPRDPEAMAARLRSLGYVR